MPKKATSVVKPKAIKTKVVPTVAVRTRVKKTVTAKLPDVKLNVESQVPSHSLTVPVMNPDGSKKGTMTLPSGLFGVKINVPLVTQAIRVYLANQREGSASTKTRGNVEGSTRKIYRQKGTGKARHGGIRAPIFVGGGIVFGPLPRDYSLKFPKEMRHKALASALTSKLQANGVVIVDGLDAQGAKTKHMAASLVALGAGSTVLLVTGAPGNMLRAAQNIEGVTVMPAQNLTTYAVVVNATLILTKDAVPVLQKTFTGKV